MRIIILASDCLKSLLLMFVLFFSLPSGKCAGATAGGATPIGGGLLLLITLSLAYAIKHYRVSKGKEEEI